MRKILIVDNSALMRRVLCDIINSDSDFRVVDVSLDGEDAYNKIMTNTYDLVVMEMLLPRLDGLGILRKLRENNKKVTIIAISTAIREDAGETMQALELGAYDFVARPVNVKNSDVDFSSHLLRVMHNAVSHQNAKPMSRPTKEVTVKQPAPVIEDTPVKVRVSDVSLGKPQLIFVASSTGGPQALHTLFAMLPATIDVPIVIVQHMPKGFTAALAERLDQICPLHVKEAQEGDVLKPGWVYIAPGGHHMLIAENRNKQMYLSVNKEPPVNSLRPCADVTMNSLLATSYRKILCVVLTGMGADGTQGIKDLKKKKDLYVITESRETCVVYGMPRSVDQNKLSNESAPIEKISEAIIKKLGV